MISPSLKSNRFIVGTDSEFHESVVFSTEKFSDIKIFISSLKLGTYYVVFEQNHINMILIQEGYV